MHPAVRSTRILVFTKSPHPGRVKTRLIPLLGQRGAARLHMMLTHQTLATACKTRMGQVELHCAPGTRHSFLSACGARYGVTLKPQSLGDLGMRMGNAFRNALMASPQALLIGTDCPALTPGHLREAATHLAAGKDAVVVPTDDGGYALIGLSRFDSSLFNGIDWGTSVVMEETRKRLRKLGWRWQELDTLWDVDRPDDYRRLIKSNLLPNANSLRAISKIKQKFPKQL